MHAIHFLVILLFIFNSPCAFSGEETSNPDLAPENPRLTQSQKEELRWFTEGSSQKARKPASVATQVVTAASPTLTKYSEDEVLKVLKNTQILMPDLTDIDGKASAANVTGISGYPEKLQVELTYQKPDGSLMSRNVDIETILQNNPKLRERFHKMISGN